MHGATILSPLGSRSGGGVLRSKVVVWTFLAFALALIVASGASAAKARPLVAVKVTVHGNGTVFLAVANAGFGCHHGTSTCTHTFHVARGRRAELLGVPAVAWKLARWGGACRGTSPRCSLGSVTSSRSATVMFAGPGTRLNPYPLRTAVGIAPGWKLTVNSAILNAKNANTLVESVKTNPPPPPGAQYALINLTMTNLDIAGGWASNLGNFLRQQMGAEGVGNARYNADTCKPPLPDLALVGQINAGQSETGNLCYLIESSDARTLVLSGWVGMGGSVGEHQIWIALH
jgi:hypothetical protein